MIIRFSCKDYQVSDFDIAHNYFSKRYVYFTKKQAIEQFKKDIEEENKKYIFNK